MAITLCKHPDGCDKAVARDGWCNMHSKRIQRHGDPGPVGKLEDPKASLRTNIGDCKHPDGCDKKAEVSGYCRTHYMRLHRHGDIGPADLIKKKDRICNHPDGCTRKARMWGLCNMHSQRLRTKGDPGPVFSLNVRHDEAPEGMRTCNTCKEIKDINNFWKVSANKDGLSYTCRSCGSKQRRFRIYGIYELETDKCEICGSEIKLCVDHCHQSGKVRGTLCDDCNKALGTFKDNPKLLKSAASYLEKFSSTLTEVTI